MHLLHRDLGHLTPDGEIKFLGRRNSLADAITKYKFAVIKLLKQLGELESMLLKNKNVESAITSLVKVGSMDTFVAYVVCDKGG